MNEKIILVKIRKIEELDAKTKLNTRLLFQELNFSKEELWFLATEYYESGLEKNLYIKKVFDQIKYGVNTFARFVFLKHRDLIEPFFDLKLEEQENVGFSIDHVKMILAEEGIIPDLKYYDELCDSKQVSVQVWAYKKCSLRKLQDALLSKNKTIRKIAYERLGPVECADIMLKDRNCDLRYDGVMMAPIFYEKFLDMADDKSAKVCALLIRKSPDEMIPLIIGNENLNHPSFKFELRMRLGE